MSDPTSPILAIDFDGTLCEHAFPEIGAENHYAVGWCREFQRLGARLILYTMRSDLHAPTEVSAEGHRADRRFVSEAVEWCAVRGLEFWAVNCNPEQKSWTQSPKPYAHLYIDDNAFGCPLAPGLKGPRPRADWSRIGPRVLHRVWRLRPDLETLRRVGLVTAVGA